MLGWLPLYSPIPAQQVNTSQQLAMYSALSTNSQLSPDLRTDDPYYLGIIADPRHVVLFLPAPPMLGSSPCATFAFAGGSHRSTQQLSYKI